MCVVAYISRGVRQNLCVYGTTPSYNYRTLWPSLERGLTAQSCHFEVLNMMRQLIRYPALLRASSMSALRPSYMLPGTLCARETWHVGGYHQTRCISSNKPNPTFHVKQREAQETIRRQRNISAAMYAAAGVREHAGRPSRNSLTPSLLLLWA